MPSVYTVQYMVRCQEHIKCEQSYRCNNMELMELYVELLLLLWFLLSFSLLPLQISFNDCCCCSCYCDFCLRGSFSSSFLASALAELAVLWCKNSSVVLACYVLSCTICVMHYSCSNICLYHIIWWLFKLIAVIFRWTNWPISIFSVYFACLLRHIENVMCNGRVLL